MLSVFQTIKEYVWKETNIHGWCSMVPLDLQVAQAEAYGIWYFIEESDGEVHTISKGQD
jgi:hypothetical protein